MKNDPEVERLVSETLGTPACQNCNDRHGTLHRLKRRYTQISSAVYCTACWVNTETGIKERSRIRRLMAHKDYGTAWTTNWTSDRTNWFGD